MTERLLDLPEVRAEFKVVDSQTVSEWADAHRILSPLSSAEPGPWRNIRTPYLVGVMDSYTDEYIEDITFMASSQVGKSECLLNIIGYIMDKDPAPTLAVLPREPDAKGFSRNRIKPMIGATPALSRHTKCDPEDLPALEYRLDRMTFFLCGANSPADLASRPIKNLLMDEIDKMPLFTGREADPISLAGERQKTFWNKKRYKSSTPTTADGYINEHYNMSDRRKYFVPCPYCGEYQVLTFASIKIPEDERDADKIIAERLAWYECSECAGKINDIQKIQMVSNGQWIQEGASIDKDGVVTGARESRHAGFWINSLYSPWLTFSDVIGKFLRAKNDTKSLMNFVNSWLGEIWEEKVEENTPETLREHVYTYAKATVPEGALVLTAGVDVQKDHFYSTVRAWGYDGETWLVEANKVESWQLIRFLAMEQKFPKVSSGESLPVRLTCIDSGYRTDEVYSFAREFRDKVKAIKGEETLSAGRYYAASKIDTNARTGTLMKSSLMIYRLNTSAYKDQLARSMGHKNPIRWAMYKDVEKAYLDQITSEYKILIRDRKTGIAKEVWRLKKGHRANHFLDCDIYARAAADMIHALNIRKETQEQYIDEQRRLIAKRKAAQSRNKSWIGNQEGNWLNR